MTVRDRSDWRTRVICGVLAILLLSISAYVFSGFHKHEPRSSKVCSFSQFEHGSSLEASGHVHCEAPADCRWRPPDAADELPQLLACARPTGRAPPSSY